MRALFRQFSFPGGIPSHVAPETPGSIHEGGELGYSLVHAYGAVFDNPDLLAAVRRSATARPRPARSPRAGTRTSSSNPVTDGAVLPVLHLNGYKIANPTVLARIPEAELAALMRGYGYEPHFVGGRRSRSPCTCELAETLDRVLDEIARDPARRPARRRRTDRPALADDRAAHPEGLDRPQGWSTGCRSRAPGARTRFRWPRPARTPSTARSSRQWMRSYRPEELFDATGRLVPELQALAPIGDAADEREPARQRRPAAARPGAARLPRLRRRRRPARRSAPARRPGCSAPSCAM